MKLSSRALNNWDLKLLKEKAQTIAQTEYTTHQYLFPLCFELYAARCDPEVRVASSASFCAQDAHKRFVAALYLSHTLSYYTFVQWKIIHMLLPSLLCYTFKKNLF